MTSLDVRSNSAVMKRAEQLKRWEESDTNREPPTPRPEKGRKIKFSSGCVFLAACLSSDKEEVIKLLKNGADINTTNVDGLTALHQACIDDNLEMVEFLVGHGADINRQDNEGWTPLHATASCGFVSIARYLVEHGADVSAVNSDGDLAVDLADDIQHLPMMEFMQKTVAEQKIDCEQARKAEEQLMFADAKRWLRSDASEVDRPHSKTGATALHVAAAKGYAKVLSLLLAGRANVDKQDNDGWTPLHAAAHWGQKEAAEMLVDAMADMDIRNYAGQTCIDVADRKMVKFLEELRANNKRTKRRPSSQIRISDTMENHNDTNTPTKIIRVEVKPDCSKDQSNASASHPSACGDHEQHNLSRISESDETDSELTDSTESSHSTSLSEPEDDKPKTSAEAYNKPQAASAANTINTTSTTDETTAEDEAPWRRNSAARVRSQLENPVKIQVPEKDVSKTNSTTVNPTESSLLRRTQSFENDEKFYQKYNELRARIKANSCPVLPATQPTTNNNNNKCNSIGHSTAGITSTSNTTTTTTTTSTATQNLTIQRSASLKDPNIFRKPLPANNSTSAASDTPSSSSSSSTTATTPIRSTTVNHVAPTTSVTANSSSTATNNNNKNYYNNNNNGTKPPSTPTSPSTPEAAKQKMSAGNIFKNFFKSFVPPARDEESETQRKAHAKRVRETRRSTQGVTLDEIKSAEELVKKKNSTMSQNNNNATNDTQTTTLSSHQPQSQQQQQQQQEKPPPSTSPPPLPPQQQQPQQPEQEPLAIFDATTTTITTNASESPQKSKEDNEDEDDTNATFTIVAPTSKQRLAAPTVACEQEEVAGNSTEDEEVSASYTLTKRRSPTLLAVEAGDDERTTQNERLSKNEEESNENKKTETKEATKSEESTATSLTGTTSVDDSSKALNLPLQPQEAPSAPTPTLDSPVRLREKRSLFDLDNASSLTLAEKLRNEANKYSSGPQTNEQHDTPSDSDSVLSNYNSRRSLDSSSLPNSPLHVRESAGGSGSVAERRPSWRLKFDAGSKFKLEDASSGSTFPPNNSAIIPSAPAVIAAANLSATGSQRRLVNASNAVNASNQSLNSIGRPVSAPIGSTASSGYADHNFAAGDRNSESNAPHSYFGSYASRRVNSNTSPVPTSSATAPATEPAAPTTAAPTQPATKSSNEEITATENDKENDNRSSASVIQRRRKPKRRSTGVVHLDMDDLDVDRQESAHDTEDKDKEKESGGERTSTARSRVGSSTSLASASTEDRKSRDRPENGDGIDYKALWEAGKIEIEKLKQQVKKKDDEIVQIRAAIDRVTSTTKNSLSEIEKRERRAMERKLSEMEEELKQLETYKAENQRLKEENGALIRVISKLSK